MRLAVDQLLEQLSKPNCPAQEARVLIGKLEVLGKEMQSAGLDFTRLFEPVLMQKLGKIAGFAGDMQEIINNVIRLESSPANNNDNLLTRYLTAKLAQQAQQAQQNQDAHAGREASPVSRTRVFDVSRKSHSPARQDKATHQRARTREAVGMQLRTLCQPQEATQITGAIDAISALAGKSSDAHVVDELVSRSTADLAMMARNLINAAPDLVSADAYPKKFALHLADVLSLHLNFAELAEALRQTRFGPSPETVLAKAAAALAGKVELKVAAMSFETLIEYNTAVRSIAREYPVPAEANAMRAAIKQRLASEGDANLESYIGDALRPVTDQFTTNQLRDVYDRCLLRTRGSFPELNAKQALAKLWEKLKPYIRNGGDAKLKQLLASLPLHGLSALKGAVVSDELNLDQQIVLLSYKFRKACDKCESVVRMLEAGKIEYDEFADALRTAVRMHDDVRGQRYPGLRHFNATLERVRMAMDASPLEFQLANHVPFESLRAVLGLTRTTRFEINDEAQDRTAWDVHRSVTEAMRAVDEQLESAHVDREAVRSIYGELKRESLQAAAGNDLSEDWALQLLVTQLGSQSRSHPAAIQALLENVTNEDLKQMLLVLRADGVGSRTRSFLYDVSAELARRG